jgi:DNA polymerase-3 subunit delta
MAALTLVLGDEDLLVARAIRRAVDAATAADPEAAVHDVEAAGLEPAALAELTSPSLFGESRVVVVRGAQDAAKDTADALVRLAEAGDESVVLVVVHSGGARNKALVEAVKGAGAVVVPAAKV